MVLPDPGTRVYAFVPGFLYKGPMERVTHVEAASLIAALANKPGADLDVLNELLRYCQEQKVMEERERARAEAITEDRRIQRVRAADAEIAATEANARAVRLSAELASLAAIYASDLRERGYDAEAEALEAKSLAALSALHSSSS